MPYGPYSEYNIILLYIYMYAYTYRYICVYTYINTILCYVGWPKIVEIFLFLYNYPGFPGGSVVKNRPASAGDAEDLGSILGLRRSSGEGNDNPFQYSCLENSMHRGAWQATVHGVTKTNPAHYLQTILSFAFGLQKSLKVLLSGS